jgi:glyceraldehyde 3-phosphate dehydrogenase
MDKVRLGIMGFGEIGRHIYRLCAEEDLFEVVAISDYGRAEILNYLLDVETKGRFKSTVENENFIVSKAGRSRVVSGGEPGSVPWDVFNADIVIDATGMFRYREQLEKHLHSGAKHVVLSTLPHDEIDRIVILGVNDASIDVNDKIVSAGSATTNAAGILLKLFNDNFGVDYATFTTVHSYTSDQPLRDKAGDSFRRSRSAAENIIPNETPSPKWLQHIFPEFEGRIGGSALNVPIPNGSLLDMTTVFKQSGVSIDDVNIVMEKAEKDMPDLVRVTEDPIVSSDVVGNRHAIVFDKLATMKSPNRMLKTLTWYHTALAQATRILDLIKKYHELEEKGGSK